MQAIEILKQRLIKPYNLPILLLGAGFSIDAMNGENRSLVLGKNLACELYQDVLYPNISSIKDYDDDKKDVERARDIGDLKSMCTKLREFGLSKERDEYLTRRMQNCHWEAATDYEALSTYPWPYIFTLNIDDLVENIYKRTEKDIVVWTDNSLKYEESPEKTILVKLHGDVTNRGRYVFDTDEYNDFIARNPRILTKFGDEYVSRDLIVLGTQFQEDDLKIVLQKLLLDKCIPTNFQYFFISPSAFNRDIRNKIDAFDNFHYIQMDTRQFLKTLRNWQIQHDAEKSLLLSNSFTDWSKEFQEARSSSKEYDLYYGRAPEAKDFFYEIDIPRRAENSSAGNRRYYLVEESFHTRLRKSESFLVTIHGEAYVGKTCLAMRLLSICNESGYQCFYTQKSDYRSIEKILDYLSHQPEGGLFAICLEDAAGCYYRFDFMISSLPDNIVLVLLTTSLETQHRTKRHNLQFMQDVWIDYYISERISYCVAEDILKKLKGNEHLGKIQEAARKGADMKRIIRSKKDLISLLWYAHEGRDFLSYFNEWYCQRKDEKHIKMFHALTFYASMGCLQFPITFLPELAHLLGNQDFSYTEFKTSFQAFWVEKGGSISLRFVRLFAKVIKKEISEQEKIEYLQTIMKVLAKRTCERDHSQFNLMFETIAKIKNIEKYADIDKRMILQMFEDVRSECGHLSYYWIQSCIIYSQCNLFEEASNAIMNAEGCRKYRTYQMIHADAKNDMARGIWCLECNRSEGEEYFLQGREKICALIDNKEKYKNAFLFSVHTYIYMSMLYYQKSNKIPDEYEWLYMKSTMWTLVEQTHLSDNILLRLVDQFIQFADEHGFEGSVRGMRRKIMSKGRRVMDIEDYDIDAMPD